MSSRRYGFHLLGRPVLGRGGDAEEALLALVERARRIQQGAPEGTQEDGSPANLERLAGQSDDAAGAHERLDPGELRAAVIEQRLRPLVTPRDRVEHSPDGLAVGGLGASGGCCAGHRPVGYPCRPELTRQADHLATNGAVFMVGPLEDLLAGQVALEGVAQLGREEPRPQPPLAHRGRQDSLGQVAAKLLERGLREGRRLADA